MPIGARNERARFGFVRAFCGECENRKRCLVRVGATLGIFTEIAFEDNRVLICGHDVFSVSVLNCSGHTWAKPRERPDSQGQGLLSRRDPTANWRCFVLGMNCFWETETVWQIKLKQRTAAPLVVGNASKQVPEQRWSEAESSIAYQQQEGDAELGEVAHVQPPTRRHWREGQAITTNCDP